MLRIASRFVHWVMDRRCPTCCSVEVRGSLRRNSYEVVLLCFIFARPFCCESCGNRFYGLAFRRRVLAPRDAKPILAPPQDLSVLVYGRRKDEEPFREETNLHLLNPRGGLITLATSVEPGQQLILMNVATEEDQRCRVAFVGEQHFGRSMVGIQFNWLTEKFWHINDSVHRKPISAAGAFWER